MLSLGQRLKQLLKHGVVFGLTSSLQSALAFVLLPLYTKYFSLEEFGGYNMLLVIVGACNTVFYLGASSVLGRFYYDYKEKGKDQDIVSGTLWLSMLGSVLLIVLSILLASPICTYYLEDSSLIIPFVLCMVGNALTYPITTLTLLLRYKKKSFFYLIVTLAGLILNFIITILVLTFSEIKVCAPFIGLVCSNVILLLVLLFDCKDDLSLNVSKETYKIELYYGAQIVLSSLLGYAYGSLDKFVIKETLSVADVGIYSLGYRIGCLYQILIYLPFVLVWSPLRMEYRKSPDNVFFIKKIASYYTMGSALFIIVCMVWGNDILLMLFPQQEYIISLQIYPIIMIGYLFYGWTDIFNFGIYVNNKFVYQSIVPIIGTVINCGLNLLLLPKYGVAVSAYIFMFTYLVAALILLFISNKYYRLPLEWGRLSSIVLLCIAEFILLNLVNITVAHGFLGKLFISIFTLLFMWLLWVDKDEKKYIYACIRKRQ
ncbi:MULTISPECIES: lipopolysaccharide biosynthesis protein [Bacteroides]|uniref:lipopolysaccharide biosynthesis protein n=1 Tax=Bacteroides TaxID=816 RepID=UPI000E42F770|nr:MULTISPECIES: oligosaccharide flippase family protein [Bacteroides]RGM45711.1 hypothetical protein DXC10_13475 [Bacteroides sp. OM08-11]